MSEPPASPPSATPPLPGYSTWQTWFRAPVCRTVVDCRTCPRVPGPENAPPVYECPGTCRDLAASCELGEPGNYQDRLSDSFRTWAIVAAVVLLALLVALLLRSLLRGSKEPAPTQAPATRSEPPGPPVQIFDSRREAVYDPRTMQTPNYDPGRWHRGPVPGPTPYTTGYRLLVDQATGPPLVYNVSPPSAAVPAPPPSTMGFAMPAASAPAPASGVPPNGSLCVVPPWNVMMASGGSA